MSPRFLATLGVGLSFACTCAVQSSMRDDRPAARVPPRSAQCEMAFAAVSASIRSHADQPLGLEKACVESVASLEGKVYVDARFNRDLDLEAPDVATCERANYVIRFDWRSFSPSPARQVVFLSFRAGSSDSREFDITTDASNWPARPPGTVGLSPCYSAYGVVHRTAAGWQAEVRQAPKSPDAL